jgi:protein disulfide-isomerase
MEYLRRLLACLWFTLAAALPAAGHANGDLPYDEAADARLQIRQALQAADASGKDVLLVFGANWCPECRRLDSSIHDDAGRLGDKRFEIVKVDVGHFDKNIDLARAYGNPIRKGIPGAAIVSADRELVYAGPLWDLLDPYQRVLKWALRLALLAVAAGSAFGAALLLRRRMRRRAAERATAA